VEVCEIGLGHSLKGLAKVYSNPTDNQIREAWSNLWAREGQAAQAPKIVDMV
jgi:hypothetical protein